MEFLKKYFLIYAIFVLGMMVFLRWYKTSHYSDNLLAEMMLSQSRFKGQTTDPCAFSIVGEPEVAGQYLKLTFKCPKKEARFSLDFRAIRVKTVGGAIEELYRINGVSGNIENLRCKEGGRDVNTETKIGPQDNIECAI